MRQETAGVTEALIESAKKEFLEYGFHNANLRRISADSGVSTNSIYTRFGDKSGLFDAVVRPAADGLMQIYLASISEASECGSAQTAADMGSSGTDMVLKYIILMRSGLFSANPPGRSMSATSTNSPKRRKSTTRFSLSSTPETGAG